MARWATIGCETTPVATDSSFQAFEGVAVTGAGAAITRDTTTKRSGAASRKHDSGASNANAYTQYAWGLQGEWGWYIRGYFRVQSLPSASCRIMMMADNSIFLGSAYLTTGGKIQLWNETGTPAQIGSDSSATITTGQWYRLELFCKVVTGASDQLALRLDGTEVASATGLSLSDSNVTQGYWGWAGPNQPGANNVIWFDDVAINNDQGSSPTSWPGAGQVLYLWPDSDNARGSNWTGGAGGTTSLFDAVNNTTVGGLASGSATDTSQIKNTNTADTTGNYDANLQSYTTGGIGASDTVNLVQSFALGGSTDATAVASAVQIVSNPAQGSEESKNFGSGSAIGTFGSNWQALWGAAQVSPSVAFGTQPVLRVGRRGTQTGGLHVCGMGLAVDYTAGVGQTPPFINVTISG